MKYILLIACLSVWASVSATVEAAQRPPNVVLILGDDQAWTDFGFMGHKDIRTPNLDRLASQGALFTRGYAPVSVCRPSLASIITGRYPHEHRLGILIDGLGGDERFIRNRFAQYPTLPQRLGPAGYTSFQAGKWCEKGFALGGFTAGMSNGIPVPGSVGANGLGPLDKGLTFLGGGEGIRIGRETMEPVYSFIRENRDRPFFLWYAPMMPHAPHNPPAELLAKYQMPGRPERIAQYMAMCEWFDQTVGQLLGFLDDQKLADHTLVAFITDNGYVQMPNFDFFDPRSKLSPYDSGLRSPIILRWPGRIKPARYDTLAYGIDLHPTILAACGVEVPQDLPGVNLLDVCNGKPAARDALFGATFRRKVEKPVEPRDTMEYRWCLTDRWKLIASYDPAKAPELYEIVADPHEKKDVAAHNPRVVRELSARLDGWWKP